MAKNFWKRISTRTLLDHPRIKIVEDEVLLPTGTNTQYLRFEGLPDYVTVIAEQDGRIAMIKEYSYPNDEWVLQFPEGNIESAESPEVAANRELQEEAGLAAKNTKLLGINYDHHRRGTARDFVVFVTEVSKVEKTEGDEEEFGTELHWVGVDEIKNLLKQGKIVQKNAAAALALYFAHFDVQSTVKMVK